MELILSIILVFVSAFFCAHLFDLTLENEFKNLTMKRIKNEKGRIVLPIIVIIISIVLELYLVLSSSVWYAITLIIPIIYFAGIFTMKSE